MVRLTLLVFYAADGVAAEGTARAEVCFGTSLDALAAYCDWRLWSWDGEEDVCFDRQTFRYVTGQLTAWRLHTAEHWHCEGQSLHCERRSLH